MTTRLRIHCAYLGTEYSGWAKQTRLTTIQGELEHALATVLRVSRKEISTIVAGRTDSGVHAIGQVAHAELADSVVLTPSALALLAKRVNGALRTDAIVVHSIDKAPRRLQRTLFCPGEALRVSACRPQSAEKPPQARRHRCDGL